MPNQSGHFATQGRRRGNDVTARFAPTENLDSSGGGHAEPPNPDLRAFVSPEETSAYLNKQAWRYLGALRFLRESIERSRFAGLSRSFLHYTYSRGSRQRGGDELKESWKVHTKLLSDSQAARTVIQDVGDIVGLTAVCPHASDISQVASVVHRLERENVLEIFRQRWHRTMGYRALHFTVGLSDPRFIGVRAELQIKTILDDAWSAWTHDLTYKPKGSLPKLAHEKMDLIGKQLRQLERDAELLKRQSELRWKWEQERKSAIREQLLVSFGGSVPSEKGRARKYGRLFRQLRLSRNRYIDGSVADELRNIRAFTGNTYDVYSCVLIVYLAALRDADDLDELALDYIERWIQTTELHSARAEALAFKAFSLLCFNRTAEAVDAAEVALAAAERSANSDQVRRRKADLVYYLAELGPDRSGTNERRARRLIRELVALRDPEPELKDSVAFALITFGREAAEIRKGIRLCAEAYRENPNRRIAKTFYSHHIRIGRRRLRFLRSATANRI
jgi:ppGpp synthetase/RelA/SpoT-type nucleotidyltranferase